MQSVVTGSGGVVVMVGCWRLWFVVCQSCVTSWYYKPLPLATLRTKSLKLRTHHRDNKDKQTNKQTNPFRSRPLDGPVSRSVCRLSLFSCLPACLSRLIYVAVADRQEPQNQNETDKTKHAKYTPVCVWYHALVCHVTAVVEVIGLRLLPVAHSWMEK